MTTRTFLIGLAVVKLACVSKWGKTMTTRTFVIVGAVGHAWYWQNLQGLPPCAIVDQPPVERGHTSLSLVGVGQDGQVRWHLKIDTGEGGFETAHRAGLPAPDLILVTHGHPDHLNRMQLDHFARAARPRRIHLVTSPETWGMIQPYPQSLFDFLPITPGQTFRTTLAGDQIEVQAVDASAHFPGALVFCVRTCDLVVGVLFDLRGFSALDRSLWEGLDVAVLDGNSLLPMSQHTGHASIAEGLAFLASLTQPPRLSLFAHYGADDEVRYTPGELSALLAGIAPHLPVRLAYRGMTLSRRTLPPRNPVAVLDPETNIVVGSAEKDEVHEGGLLHASVLIAVRDAEGRLVLPERHAFQSYPGCIDLFGGHMQPSDAGDPRRAAEREATEEIRLYTLDLALRVALDPAWLYPISPPFELVSNADKNRERTTVFGLQLPPGVAVKAFDEVRPGEDVELVLHRCTLDEALALPDERLADGLRRVIDRCRRDKKFLGNR